MSNGRWLLDHYERDRIANAAREQARSDYLAEMDNAQGDYLAHQEYDPLIAEWAELWTVEYEAAMQAAILAANEAEDEEEDEDE